MAAAATRPPVSELDQATLSIPVTSDAYENMMDSHRLFLQEQLMSPPQQKEYLWIYGAPGDSIEELRHKINNTMDNLAKMEASAAHRPVPAAAGQSSFINPSSNSEWGQSPDWNRQSSDWDNASHHLRMTDMASFIFQDAPVSRTIDYSHISGAHPHTLPSGLPPSRSYSDINRYVKR